MQRLAAIALSAVMLGAPVAAQESAADAIAIMVFDASGSMWNRLEEDLTRIEVARDVMEEYFHTRDTSVPLAVIAYGHRQRGACSDIEMIAPLAQHEGADLAAKLRALNPQGMTPLTDSMAMARDMIPPTAESADLILVTDGLENCGGDPCALAAELAAQGINIRAHVVGFGMTEAEINTLSCLPEQTGGRLILTNSGAELAEAMTAVSTPSPQPEVAEADPVEEVAEAGPAEEGAEADTPEVTISGPRSVRIGEDFQLQWSDTINERDIVAILPMGADEDELGTWARVGESRTETDLRAPADPGMYELRYILGQDRRTLATAPIEVITADAEISGPNAVRSGENFRVQWSEPINSRDLVAIVPMGADEGELGTWSRVGSSDTQTYLRAPSDPGMYELRYILDEGRGTLARASIEVTTPEAEISGPDSVRIGESFRVQWSEPINDRDIVAIVPMGAEEGELGTWSRVGSSDPEGDLRAPSDPGMYELRYILDEGRGTLARAAIEVTAVDIDVMGPDKIRAGDTLRASWSDRVNDRDIVAIVPLGADVGELGDWTRIGSSAMQNDFDAPEDTGMYELRYILDEGRITLGQHTFEVVDAMAALGDGVMLTVPETATPGASITVTWSGSTDGADQRIALARADQALFTWISAEPIEELTEITFTMPEEPGYYEIRFLDLNAQDVLSSARIEVR
ncbi:vWA domain-containing protein [Roseinatronobacter monicus]|uniref:Ca-activated chloride channel family protein n=1 Tax=Roseinatronobacter monicus TaxID=393481 RepID=A0A543KH30_9RHOB|nr:VWA domain-containing protein [Roseinatronobacter monicus]TQM94379.1 Ca-activated chloride channel family protein [Roseinatronobacter monicus]